MNRTIFAQKLHFLWHFVEAIIAFKSWILDFRYIFQYYTNFCWKTIRWISGETLVAFSTFQKCYQRLKLHLRKNTFIPCLTDRKIESILIPKFNCSISRNITIYLCNTCREYFRFYATDKTVSIVSTRYVYIAVVCELREYFER